MYFASEWEMLSLITSRNQEELYSNDEGYSYFMHKKNTVSSIPVDFKGNFKDIPAIEFEGYKAFFPPAVVTGTTKKVHIPSKKATTAFETKKLFGKDIYWEVSEKFPVKGSTDIRIQGYCFTDTQEEVSCVVTAEVAAQFEADDPVSSTIKKVINRKDLGVLYISNIDIESLSLLDVNEKKTTMNGEVVYKDDWDALQDQWKQCGNCTGTVMWSELGTADVSFMGARIPRYCICSDCTSLFYDTKDGTGKSWKN
jgi:hypothetical protein